VGEEDRHEKKTASNSRRKMKGKQKDRKEGGEGVNGGTTDRNKGHKTKHGAMSSGTCPCILSLQELGERKNLKKKGAKSDHEEGPHLSSRGMGTLWTNRVVAIQREMKRFGALSSRPK